MDDDKRIRSAGPFALSSRSNCDAYVGQRGLMPSPQGLHKAENKYVVGKIRDGEEAKQRRIKAILNKLTPQNFDKLFEQVIDVGIDNPVTLTGLVHQIFNKALMEPIYCEMYANLCYYISEAIPDFVEGSEKITFKRLLLNKCQEEFERCERERADPDRVEEGGVEQTEEEMEEKRIRARKRMLGNIRFIGEFYRKKMLTERIMHECIRKLLEHGRDLDEEEDIEALCLLMSTIGEVIDNHRAKEHMDGYFEEMTELSANQKLSPRVRFLLMDTIDLRVNKWRPRIKVEGPKKIIEVHRDAARERQCQGSRSPCCPVVGPNRRRGRTVEFSLFNTQFQSRSLLLPQRSVDDNSTLGPQYGLTRGRSPNFQTVETFAVGDFQRMPSCQNGYNPILNPSSFYARDSSSFYSDFPCYELEEATENFSPSLKIGEGASGIVYKGFLRNTLVAIKVMHPESLQGRAEFEKEVAVLSRVRHPNLVTLIGACPDKLSLIYEYLPNGTLEDHITCARNSPSLSWQIRTRIIAEICSALIFLHATKPQSVIHGDLKPGNILLDSNSVSKLCDFGNTNPKGTSAYMDPEFVATGELTSQSDTYSFGIIILRLLTGRPAIAIARDVQGALDNNMLHLVIDPSAGDWPFVQVKQLAHLGLRCCETSRENRPDLVKDVWRTIEPLMSASSSSSLSSPSFQSVSDDGNQLPSYFICPIFQEIMSDPHIAADGFTYEVEAIRGWIESGHNTSPMTNSKLEHCELIPNRALRSAIQEWLQQGRSFNKVV